MALVRLMLIRRALRRDRVFRDRRNPLDSFDDNELYDSFRFYRHEIFELADEISPVIEHASRQGSLPPAMQLMIALRYYASGTFFLTIGELFGVDKATVSRTITEVTAALVNQLALWVKLLNQQQANIQKVYLDS